MPSRADVQSQLQPRAQGGAQRPGLGMPQCPWLPASGCQPWGQGVPEAPSPQETTSPHCTLAVLNHVLRISGSFAIPSPVFPCTQAPLYPLLLPQGLPLPVLTVVPPLTPGFLHEFLQPQSMTSLSCLISSFLEVLVRQQSFPLLHNLSCTPPALPFPTAAALGACLSVILQFYRLSSSPALILGSFLPSFSIICPLKRQQPPCLVTFSPSPSCIPLPSLQPHMKVELRVNCHETFVSLFPLRQVLSNLILTSFLL